jgi:antitoxin (DNA-binding transcriptional repressor) of toxin-antitoxin stability system
MYVEIALISTKGAGVGKNEHQMGAFVAKTRLLDRVAAGEHITITRHGTPIARLVPVRAGGSRRGRP